MGVFGFGFARVLLALALTLALTGTSTAKTFKCGTSGATCHSLIGYVVPNATSLAALQTLFGVKNLRLLLGANGLSSPPAAVPANQTIRIPFRCACANGTGHSAGGRPVYVVRPDDDLDHIASDIFGHLVTYKEIAAANNIPNPDQITVGQRLHIPLPCSCDRVDGADVVHHGHVVAAGSSVDAIAAEYGVSNETLLRLNGIDDPKTLQAGDVLDVPLRACTSVVANNSKDYPLLVPNGTNTYTAENCVMCKCDAANNWTLQCEPSKLKVAKNSTWSTCPATSCNGVTDLSLGSISTLQSACDSQSCAYAGYTNQSILTLLTNASTCSANNPSGNHAATMLLQGSSWSLLFIFVHFVLLHLNVLQ